MATLDRVVVDGGRVGLAATSCVRVHDLGGEVAGSGFLIGPGLVATCAHVVADAIGADPTGPAPAGPVPLEFPVLPGASARVTGSVARWVPVDGDGRGDVALLRLGAAAPDGITLPPVRSPERLWDRPYRTFGFPEGRDDGVWSTGRIRAAQGTGWCQLQGTVGDQPIAPGSSGAPVWDERTGAVVGMTVAADRDPDVTTAYLIPIADVLGLDPDLLPSPYRGLEPFAEEHAEFFHGREPELARLLDAVAAAPLVAVAGPSGCGKSSLVRAGLLPRLRERGTPVGVLGTDPGARAAAVALAGAVLAAADPAADPARRDRDAARIGAALGDPATRRDGTAELADALRGRDRTVLVCDQFEELLESTPEQARALLEIVHALATEHDAPLCTVLTLRAAALDEIVTPELAGTLGAGTVLVGPMDSERLRRVITGPAEHAPGLAFEAGLVERILDDVPHGASQLPLLESLLARLWESRGGGALTSAAYDAVGGVAGALADRAERAVEAAVVGDDAERALSALLGRLVGVGADGEPVRRTVRYLDIPDDARALIPALAARRLVVLDGHGDESTVELAHLALAEHWPRLRERVEADGAFLRWRTELDTSRRRWEDTGRDDDALPGARALDEAQRWDARHDELAEPDRDYLRRGRERRLRAQRRRRLIALALAAALLLAVGLTAVAVTSRARIADQQAAADAETLGRLAAERRDRDPVLAAELGLAAHDADPTSPAARTALATASATLGDATGAPLLHHDGSAPPSVLVWGTGPDTVLQSVAAQADGRPAIRLVRDPLGPTPQHRDIPRDVYAAARVSQDGRWAALPRQDGGLDLLDLRAPPDAAPVPLAPGGSGVDGARFSGQTRYLGWVLPGPGGPRLQRLDLHTGAMLPDTPLTGWKTALPMDDPSLIVAGKGQPGTLALLSVPDLRPVRPIAGAVYPGPPTVGVTCSDSGTVTVSDVLTGATRTIPYTSPGGCPSDPVSSDGRYLLADRQGGDGMWQWTATPLDGGPARTFSTPDIDAQRFSPDASPRVGIADGPDGPVALVSVGPEVVAFGTRPMPDIAGLGGFMKVSSDVDERFAVTVAGDAGRPLDVRVAEAATGRTVTTRPGLLAPYAGTVVGHDLWAHTQAPGGRWQVAAYALPGLDPRVTIPVAAGPGRPERTGGASSVVTGPDGRAATVVALDNGVLSAYDAASGRPLGAPITLSRTPSDVEFYRGRGTTYAREGHPGQALVFAPGGRLQLWDVPGGRMLTELLVGVDAAGPMAAGPDRVVGYSDSGRLVVGDLRTGRVTEHPYPNTSEIVGFTSDGLVVTKSDVTGGTTSPSLALYDPALQRITASMPAPSSIGSDQVAGTTVLSGGVVTSSGREPTTVLSTDAARWREVACRVAPPEPSPALRGLLPPGVDPGSCP